MKILLAAALIMLGYTANATTYYLSNSGNDANSGTTSSSPWQTLIKLNSFKSFKPGDNILFERGDTFYGTITVSNSGSSGNPITYSAYGTGANPVITGFTTVSSWTNLGGNIWESSNAVSTLSTCNIVAINGVNTAMGRYPNTGWRTIGSSTVNSITDNSLDATNWSGAEVVIKELTYVVDRFVINSQSGKSLNFTNTNYTATPGWGYFIQNDKRTLDQQNEWYYNPSTKKIDIYCTSSPVNVQLSSVEVLSDMHLKNYITFDGLDFTGANSKTFFIGSSKNITIQNCNLNNTGWTAIYGENYAANNFSDNLIVKNCSFNNNPQGIKIDSYFHSAYIVNNTFKNTGLVYGSWTNEESQACAILTRGDNSIIEYNNIDSTGYIGILFTGDNVVVRYNFVTNSLTRLDDGGGIYTVGYPPGSGRQVYNNIVLNNTGTSSGTDGSSPIAYGIYMDDYSNSAKIFNNTVSNCATGGIYIHNADSMDIHNNVCYDNGDNGGIILDGNGTYLRHAKVHANILIAKTADQRTATYKSSTGNYISTFGAMDSNYYARPIDGNSNIDAVHDYADHPLSLGGWQTFSAQDGRSFGTGKTISSPDSLSFFYNATIASVTLSLSNNYIDVKGNAYPGSVTLAPYSSIVLIKNGSIVKNIPPSANAGSDQIITLPTNNTTLSGSGSDADGSISSFSWTEISGPTSAAINNANSASAAINGLVQGTYQFLLTVTDDQGALGKDTVAVQVNAAKNIAPTSNAGSDQIITLPVNNLTLSGSGNDPDGTVSQYFWTKISGPASGTINNANSALATVNSLIQGTYDFELQVTDNRGAIGKDTVEITVKAPDNIPPTAQAGVNQTITLPVNNVTLSGTGSDVDGTVTSYKWINVSGPSGFSVNNSSSATATVTGLQQGFYQFELTVTDDKGDVGKDTVAITVNPAENIAPTANAGTNQSFKLPKNSTILSGTGNDVDGTIASYFWTKISGPARFTLNNFSSNIATVNDLVTGIYEFQLTVTDDKGATGIDTVQITINPADNIPPAAAAGADQSITLPTNNTILYGNGNDVDGTVAAYSWAIISGPSNGSIQSPASAITNVIGLSEGIYQFELTVTDDKGATGKDTVKIVVNTAENIPPAADAGADQSITLPTNKTILYGNGNDVDGTIAAYSWLQISGPSASSIEKPSASFTNISGLSEGIYQFELTVTDDKGATAKDTVNVTVNLMLNIPPTADAGSDQIITLPTNDVTLPGTGTDVDGTIAGYSWAKISGPDSGTINNADSSFATVAGLAQGIYQFELTVTDNNGAIGKDSIEVTVNAPNNIAPTANAGTDQIITLPTNEVTLSGSGNDTDGTIAAYLWTKISGPSSGTINNANSSLVTVTGLAQGIYYFELAATDNDGAIGRDTVLITVNAPVNIPPTANAGMNQTITLPASSATLSGSGNDVDGTIASYKWIKISGPSGSSIKNSTSATSTVKNLIVGTYEFALTVTDNKGAIGKDTVEIIVTPAVNIAPTSDAGADQSINLPTNNTILYGSGNDADGSIAAYSWVEISGPLGSSIANPSSSFTNVSDLSKGVYRFELTVTDNKGATGKDTVQVNVIQPENIAPVANAGANQTITLPTNNIILYGSGSDAGGTISGASWTKISGPADGSIENASSAVTNVTGLSEGTYQFELSITDNIGAIGKDTVDIVVNAAVNLAPTADAGTDQVITLPTNNTILYGSGDDADGTIANYSWVKISGPSQGLIENASAPFTNVSGLSEGVYEFELTVSDNQGAIGKDTVEITINRAQNIAPTADAGTNQTITLPVNNVILSGSGSDMDGTIVSYKWNNISGPGSETINNADSSSVSVAGLVQGVYEFELTVTDNEGAIGKDTMEITVNPAENIAPTANAGINQTITLPVNNATLSGNGNDVDGTIAGYLWTKISGPGSETINNANSSSTTITDLVQGVYQFELAVTDDKGAVGKDTVEVDVNAANNIAPTANAGFNQTITLPTNSVTLTGSGNDVDGTVAGYSWTKISGPSDGTIQNPSLPSTDISELAQGIYQFELTVTDDKGDVGKDTVEITVKSAANIPPTADAGIGQTIKLPTNSITLSGKGSDTDGTVASYSWIKISGPSGSSIANAASAITDVTGFKKGFYEFQLTVTDDKGAIGKDVVEITVNPADNIAPVANAGSNQSITMPKNGVILFGSGSDADGKIAGYSWSKISGPASSTVIYPNSAFTIITGLTEGDYKFELAVTDNDGAVGKDTVEVIVNAAKNIAPTVQVEDNQTITLPINSITLSGTGNDVDGTIASYLWTKISGSSDGTINNPSSSFTNATGLSEGVYQFELTVTDDKGATAKDTVEVTVNPALNIAPVANAGADQAITLPRNGIILLGSGSDVDGTISNYLWTKISGPGSEAINNADSAFTVVTGLTDGVYQFELKVTDDKGAIGKDTVSITVNPAINIPPTADAGSDQTITLPANNVILSGSGNDIDGIVASYAWAKISGPLEGTIENFSSASTTVSGLVEGNYQFELTVTDDKGASSKDTVEVLINPAKNIAPTANAGLDQQITLPASAVLLTGRGNDVDGSVASYSWIKIDGPSSGTINNSQAASATITDLTAGVYQYELTVTDNKGAVGKDTVIVTVNPPINIAPTASAGSNQAITLPTSSVILSGSGADVDGTIASYQWSNLSGPSGFSLDNSSSAISTIKNLVVGTYEFELAVTDNQGAIAKDTVEIIVKPAQNIAPTAHAGADQVITLPNNGVILFGTGSDADGSISSYLWTRISGPTSETINSANSGFTVVNGLIQGIYQFELTVTDDKGAIGKDTVEVTVNPAKNIPPAANAGSDQIITLPTNGVILFGNGNDADGTVTNYYWANISGPDGGIINNADSSITIVSGLLQGVYQFELTVTDNKGAIGKDTIQITVNPALNIAPTANAGSNRAIALPTDSLSLYGVGNDLDGTVSSYNWSKISGPSGFTLANSSSALATAKDLVQGTYQFELTVTDNQGATGKDTVDIVVNPAPNLAPTAKAGIDQNITLPINQAILSGSGNDIDGTIAGYVWTKISGPNSAAINNANSASATVAGLVQGVYQFELTVTDNEAAIGKDTVKIIVNPAINIPPTADAGANQTITLPINSINLKGSGSDVDGVISGYLWKEISGPNSKTINNANSASANVNGLEQGFYQFELTVTDNKGAIGKDTVSIKVNTANNIPPTADAGADQTITVPINHITLSGSGNDLDGTVAGYSWAKISGPATASIKNPSMSLTDISGLLEGVYQFELTVTDDKGDVGKDTVVVTVNPAANIPPTAFAGVDQTIMLPINYTSLTGSGNDADGSITSFSWIKISGPSNGKIKNANSALATATDLEQGTYEFELTVTDDKGALGKDTVQIMVNAVKNIPPTAHAGADINITLPTNNANLLGSGSDADGRISGYLWTKISGPVSGTINNANFASASVHGLVQGVYQFELTVTDDSGAIGNDTMTVIANAANNIPPVANAGLNQIITLPVNNVNLLGSGSDVDGYIASYRWSKISGPSGFSLNHSSFANATAAGLSQGIYQFELTVTDDKGDEGKDTVEIKVNAANNISLTANAGLDQTITLPSNSIILSGSGNDADGTILAYLWTKIAGPEDGIINNANSQLTVVTQLAQGSYQFELTVLDDKGVMGKDTVKIKVNAANNIPPTANAGTDETITLPLSNVTLHGIGSDVDGTISAYTWIKISGPSADLIQNPSSSSTGVSGLSEGIYEFELTVTDNKGDIGKDTIQVKVNAAANIPPSASAGKDEIITLPVNSVILSGSGSDTDGTIASYKWTKISGPSAFSINNSSAAVATVSGLSEGIYEFELTVTDNKGAIGKDTVAVQVNEAKNIAPVANAGINKSVTLPVNTITLSGSGNDVDGTISSYLWTKISGPVSETINNANSASTSIVDLVQGTYQFELTVTDNKGAVGKDTVSVKVNEANNVAPTANAGTAQTISLPVNSVILSGSGTDSDGTIVSYSWAKKSGPSDFTLNNSSSTTTTVSGLVKGTYEFELTVTDNNGAIGKSTVRITVNAANNIAPTANAGTDQTITLPLNDVTLSGSGQDMDGNVASYTWVKISGPGSETINNSNSSSTMVSGLVQGTYQFELTVTDNDGATGRDTVLIKVNADNNIAPIANAGNDTTILSPASTVTLNGTAIDSDGKVTNYNWKQISGPSQSIILQGDTETPDISALAEGTYNFELTVTDDKGAVGKDTVNVTVALARFAPQVNTTISVYPNPVRDFTTVDINTGRPNTHVLMTLTDVSGKVVYKKQFMSQTENVKEIINMSNFSKGTYVVTLYFDNVLRKSIKVLKL